MAKPIWSHRLDRLAASGMVWILTIAATLIVPTHRAEAANCHAADRPVFGLELAPNSQPWLDQNTNPRPSPLWTKFPCSPDHPLRTNTVSVSTESTTAATEPFILPNAKGSRWFIAESSPLTPRLECRPLERPPRAFYNGT